MVFPKKLQGNVQRSLVLLFRFGVNQDIVDKHHHKAVQIMWFIRFIKDVGVSINPNGITRNLECL